MTQLQQPESDFRILPLYQHHRCNSFSSGSAEFQPLKVFLQNDALSFQNGCIAQTYVVVNDNQREDKSAIAEDFPYTVLGYITLTCSEVSIHDYDLGEFERASHYDYLPAVKIARLAIDRRYRRSGLGTVLFEHALLVAFDEIRPRIGCRFLITDAKRSAIDFYHDKGMELLQSEDNHSAEHPIMYWSS